MDKTTPRGRRNGNHSDAAPPPLGDGARTTTTAVGRQTLSDAVRDAAGDFAVGLTTATARVPALQDALMDERNDVLSVINELEDQLDRHQELRESLERELSGTSERLHVATTRAQELEWQVVTLQTRVDALEQARQQAAALEEELADATARVQRATEQAAATEKEKAALRSEVKAANKQVEELHTVRKERDGLRSDYRALTVKVDELERSHRELFEDRSRIQVELQQALGANESLVSERSQLQVSLRTADDRVRELASVQESLVERVESLRSDKKALQAQLTHLERENTRLVEQRQFYECEVTSLRNQVRTAESALQSVKKAFGEVRIALSDTRARAQRRMLDAWPRIGLSGRNADAGAGLGAVVAQREADESMLQGPRIEPAGVGVAAAVRESYDDPGVPTT